MQILIIPLAMAIPAIIGLASAGIAAYSQHRQNKKNREAQERANQQNIQYGWDMYERQRKDALTDAEYNSPLQQMMRLKEAGLNPNLVYDKGAQSAVAQIRSANAGSTDIKPFMQEKSGLFEGLNSGMGMANSLLQGRMIQAQTDNLYTNQALQQAQTAKTIQETARGKFDLELANDIRGYSLDAARLANEKTQAEIAKLEADKMFTLDQNERNEVMNSVDVAKKSQEVVLTKLQAKQVQLENEMNPLEREKLQNEIQNLIRINENLQKDAKIKELEAQIKQKEIEMRKNGINPNSPTWTLTLYELWRKILGE